MSFYPSFVILIWIKIQGKYLLTTTAIIKKSNAERGGKNTFFHGQWQPVILEITAHAPLFPLLSLYKCGMTEGKLL